MCAFKHNRYTFLFLVLGVALFLGSAGNALAQSSQSRNPESEEVRMAVGDPKPLNVESMSEEDVAKSLETQGISERDIKRKTREEAFDVAIQGLLPLQPEEIRTLLERFDRTQEAVELPVYPNPKPEVAVETLSLDPGEKPATIEVAYGHVTTVSFLDSTGAPWPIQDVSWAGHFDVMESGEQGSHIIRITPQSEFASGNMSIRLIDLQTPVIVSLETGRDRVHYRFDAIIPVYGPNAKAPLIDGGITLAAGDQTLGSVLQGLPPEKAEKLVVTGVDGRTSAYKVGDVTYLRTPLTLLSPSWNASVASADGMHVYALAEAPVVLLSDDGRMVRAYLNKSEGGYFDEQ